MSLLLALTGAVEPPAPPPPPPQQATPGPDRRYAWNPPTRRRRRELDEVMAQPAPAQVVEALSQPVEIVQPALNAAQRAYIDGVFAAIVRAKNEQDRARKLAEIATAEQEATHAQMLLAEAVEAERVAKQQMMDFDIAFVAAVLMES
jgi:hypothetical protein